MAHDIIHVDVQPDARRLELISDGQPPHALHGAWVPYLGVVLHDLLSDEAAASAPDDLGLVAVELPLTCNVLC